LNDDEVNKRRQQFGTNELQQKKKRSILKIVFDQFKDVMILVLIAASFLAIIFGGVEYAMGTSSYYIEFINGGVILFIVALNGTIGAIQEVKASNALDALKKIGAPTSRVIRSGKTIIIPTCEIVLGDVVYIEDGSIVPADLRLIESSNLKIQEAALTGESVPVDKKATITYAKQLPMADRKNICYSSSIVTYGNGVGVVVSIGMKTEVGKIATMLNDQKEEESPIKKKLNKVGKILTIVGAVAAAVILIIGFATIDYSTNKSELLRLCIEPVMLAITLAVAVIPEGLPAMATIVMALGVQRMAKKNAIVRKLPVVETLGSATVICSDKTGTLTLNRMTVTTILTSDDILKDKVVTIETAAKERDKYRDIIDCGILCNNAQLDENDPTLTVGDPTEGALLNLGAAFEISYKDLRIEHPRLFEQPFDSNRKRMSSMHKFKDGPFLFTKGAAEELLQKCTHIQTSEGIREKSRADVIAIHKLIHGLSEQALRVLGYAKTKVDENVKVEDLEHDLVFIGLVGMIDPPRKEVINAVKTCHEAGIRTIMITGDHKITAKVIATELGIYAEGNLVISGDELTQMDDKTLNESVRTATVFARVSPADKLRIVKALQSNKEIVSMTGDGVNDAPALKSADIGVAMGITGTDVAKDASDMILLDDNFTTIESAIFEGRRIYRNIQKVIQYLLAGNVAEILLVLVVFVAHAIAIACGNNNLFHEALNPIQLLCINLLTETIPCIALGLDPAEKDIMKQKAHVGGSLFEKGLIRRTI
jgi:Ca2+-transporting ATPase